jgi:site-specific DNA-methyltransferase (adenine-specific)
VSAVVTHGDALDVLTALPDASVDAVVTDPPYELGFMGKGWDASGIAYNVGLWREALRVLRPGGHLLAFGGTRTYHRLACAVEDAGFEIRDSITWLYGSGFPKSHDVSKAIDKAAGATRKVVGKGVNYDAKVKHGGTWTGGCYAQDAYAGAAGPLITAPATPEAAQWSGWGTALKPASEPIVVARKPLAGTVAANVLAHGTGALNIDACRTQYLDDADRTQAAVPQSALGVKAEGGVYGFGTGQGRTGDRFEPPITGRWPANVVLSHTEDCVPVGERTVRGDKRDGGDGTRAGGFGDVRTGTDGNGRPAGRLYGDETVEVFDCAPGCPVAELDAQSGVTVSSTHTRGQGLTGGTYGAPGGPTDPLRGVTDSGGASRFFPTFRYQAKAPTRERPKVEGIAHPTVKPLALMRWLVRLVTPPGGTVLDPFAGSGTTVEACLTEGFACVAIEREAEYLPLIQARIDRCEVPDALARR